MSTSMPMMNIESSVSTTNATTVTFGAPMKA